MKRSAPARERAPSGLRELAKCTAVVPGARGTRGFDHLHGAALAGASPEAVAALSAYGLPLGEAFQLRDDLLGVYGDPATTGKPAGDDLVEGKRTVLVALAMDAAPAADAAKA
mgnify:CR=1 FL=1